MDITKVPIGDDPPHDVNVVVEIPGGSQVKYEMDKESGVLFVDRFLFTTMSYPAAYGFIPCTLADDGEPANALVLTPDQVVPGCLLRSRPIGMLLMEDEAGENAKVICVPHDRVHPQHATVETIEDLPDITRLAIEHFFDSYKTLESGKWVRLKGWAGKPEAEAFIRKSADAFRQKQSRADASNRGQVAGSS
jgi:inorganic pyrophosphatase